MELKTLLLSLNPFQSHDNIRHLVSVCQRRMQTLQSLKQSSARHHLLDNSGIETLHQRLKRERLLARHQTKIAEILSTQQSL